MTLREQFQCRILDRDAGFCGLTLFYSICIIYEGSDRTALFLVLLGEGSDNQCRSTVACVLQLTYNGVCCD